MLLRFLLDMPAKLVSHCGDQLAPEDCVAARSKSPVKRSGQDRDRHSLVNRSLTGPAAFARIRHASRELLQLRVLAKRGGSEVQQPGRNHAPAAPELGDVRKVEV